VSEGILSTIGHTPLINLARIFPEAPFQLFGKMEGFNPGGSIKDRAAYTMLKHALDTGLIQPGSTVIESSSGNLGIGLAQACAYLQLRFICIVDPKTTSQNLAILKAYGAEIEMVTEPDPATGEYLSVRIQRVQELQRKLPNSWWTNQYANPFNAAAHHQTMDEIATALGGRVDYLFCATSTCGTLRGCSEYIRAHGLSTTVIAVDALGSVIFGDHNCPRLIPGHGASRRPELYCPDLAERCIHVSDLGCVVGCRQLLASEAILAGGSSGAIIAAISQMQHELPPTAVCVAILCDRGERYLNTIYSDAWVAEHFGDVAYLWSEARCCT
jgi:N-(2-amino-2-carboxyethyl)-L-glutamate synthase